MKLITLELVCGCTPTLNVTVLVDRNRRLVRGIIAMMNISLVRLEVALMANRCRAIVIRPLRRAGASIGSHTLAVVMTNLIAVRSTTITTFPLRRAITSVWADTIASIGTGLGAYWSGAVGIKPT